MTRKRGFTLVAIIISLSLCAGSLFSQGLPNPGPKAKYFFYFSQRGMNHPWNVVMQKSFSEVMEKYKDRVAKYVTTNGENDAAKQLSDIETVLKMKPDLMILTAQSYEVESPVAKMCRDAGVALLVIDRRINAVPGKDYFAYIGSDIREAARSAARVVVGKLQSKYGKYKGNIVEITGTAGSSIQIDRSAGFRDVISQYPDIKIIASQDGDFMKDNAMRIMENYLQRFPKGQIDVAYGQNDEIALGVLAAVQEAGRKELLGWIASIDGQRNALKEIIDGNLMCSPQTPAGYGEISMVTALNYLDGKPVKAEVTIPFMDFNNTSPAMLKATKEHYKYQMENDVMY